MVKIQVAQCVNNLNLQNIWGAKLYMFCEQKPEQASHPALLRRGTMGWSMASGSWMGHPKDEQPLLAGL